MKALYTMKALYKTVLAGLVLGSVIGVAAGGGTQTLIRGDLHSQQRPQAADIGFAQDMAVHHGQAVEMSDLAQRQGTDIIKAWGAKIGEAQAQEIGRFFGWLDVWNASHVAKEPMAWMHDKDAHAHHHDHSKHQDITVAMGMATVEEMNRLRALEGEAFDILFLQLMIRHHQGGVIMAQAGVERAATDTVREMCNVIARGQSKEIFDMAVLLRAKGGEMLPFGVPSPQTASRG